MTLKTFSFQLYIATAASFNTECFSQNEVGTKSQLNNNVKLNCF